MSIETGGAKNAELGSAFWRCCLFGGGIIRFRGFRRLRKTNDKYAPCRDLRRR